MYKMKKASDIVSVLDTIIDGKDENYEGVMKRHRNHYGQFYNIYRQLGRKNDGIEYVDVDEENAVFKIHDIDIDTVMEASEKAEIYEVLKTTSINVAKDGNSVIVNISIK